MIHGKTAVWGPLVLTVLLVLARWVVPTWLVVPTWSRVPIKSVCPWLIVAGGASVRTRCPALVACASSVANRDESINDYVYFYRYSELQNIFYSCIRDFVRGTKKFRFSHWR